MNKNAINESLKNSISPEIEQQYFLYKEEIAKLKIEYENLKKESVEIAKIIKQMQDDNMIDTHISKMFLLINNPNTIQRRKINNQQNINKVNNYFQKVQTLSINGLKTIFNIRKFFTGQEFEIYIENKGRIFSFSLDDIESHAGNIIPIYTDSLEKIITNMEKNSKSISTELKSLGLSLKTLNDDLEVENIQSYLDFVNYHTTKNKIKISENRKLEAAIYLYNRKKDVDFSNKSSRHSMHIMLGQYIARGGTKENIAMYKLGDAVRKTNNGFKNIEVKMHNGTISLTMIANAINKLNSAFNSTDVKNKIIKFFNVNINKLSSPIEKEAQKEAIKSIENVFKNITKT